MWGGGERYALDICAELKEKGEDVGVIVCNREAVAAPFEKAGIPTILLPFRGMLDMRTIGGIAKEIRRYPGEVIIHVHDFKKARVALLAALFSGKRDKVRIICTRHLAKPAKTSLSHSILYNNLSDIIFVSEYVKNTFLSSDPKIKDTGLHVILNSIRKKEEEDYRETEKKPGRILFLGRISPEKGLEILFDALSFIKDKEWELVICGEGEESYVNSLKKRTEELRISERIHWSGYVEDVYSRIASAEIGVVPSIWEAFGLVILEFMSMGVPVIATSTGAQKEIIDSGKDGILIEKPDAKLLADALSILLEDKELALKLGTSARDKYRDCFSYPVFFSGIRSLYHKERF